MVHREQPKGIKMIKKTIHNLIRGEMRDYYPEDRNTRYFKWYTIGEDTSAYGGGYVILGKLDFQISCFNIPRKHGITQKCELSDNRGNTIIAHIYFPNKKRRYFYKVIRMACEKYWKVIEEEAKNDFLKYTHHKHFSQRLRDWYSESYKEWHPLLNAVQKMKEDFR